MTVLKSDLGNAHKGGNTASHLKVLREGTMGKKAPVGKLAHAKAESGERMTGREWPRGGAEGDQAAEQLEWNNPVTRAEDPSAQDTGRTLKSVIIQGTAVLKSDYKFGAEILKK